MIAARKRLNQQHWLKPLLLAIPMFAFCMASVAADRWQSLAQPVFQSIEHNGQLLDGPIRATAQDREGFIWLVSDNTLWRWDAYQLVPVRFDLQKSKYDLAPDVQTIKADPNGELWVGTSKGLYQIKQNPLRLQRVEVTALHDHAIDQISFDFSSGKQRLFMSNEFSVIEWQVGSQDIHLLSIGQDVENRIHAMTLEAHAQLWVGTSNGLLVKSLKDPSQQPLRKVHLASDVQRISALYMDSNKQLWIGTAKDGVYVLNPQQHIQHIALPKQSNNPWIYDITEARPGVLWFGTFGKGILEYHVKNQTFNIIRQQRGLKRNLLDNDIWSFFKDQRGLIWIGSRRGVSMYNPMQTAFQYIPSDIGNQNSGLDSQIFSVMASTDDQLWLGTSANGIQIIAPENGLIQQMSAGQRFGTTSIPDDAIESLFQVDENTVLAGSTWNTLQIKRKPLMVQPLTLPGRTEDTFSNAFALHRGNLWVGGIDGLWRMPGFDQSMAVNVSRGKSADYRISTLLSTKEALWVGTWRGLYQVIEPLSPSSAIDLIPVKQPSIDQQYITDLLQDAQHRLWVGTYSAGLLYNTPEGIAQNRPWGKLTENDGLPGNSISSVQTDLKGNLWVATTQGIAIVDAQTLKIIPVPTEQGAAAAPYEDGAKTVAGEIVFVGNNGLTIIQPELWHPVDFKAPIVISSITTNVNRKQTVQQVKNAQGVWQNSVTLLPDIHRISIEFTALDYIVAAHLKYRYRLIGFDNHWIETDAKHRTATYTTLAPRNYEMQVQYSTDGQTWQNGTYSLFINVQPHWYEKTWIILLIVAIVTALIISLFKWRSKKYLSNQRTLEWMIAERTAELEQANQLLKQQKQTIEEASLTDHLTGLKNRRYFSQHIEADIALADRQYLNHVVGQSDLKNSDLIFFIIDIDHFKIVNDKWGHASGDKVLIEMHHRLSRVFRESDYIIRWGGEEFLVVARGTSRHRAAEVAERICQSVSLEPITVSENVQHFITCSIGYAAYPFFINQPKALSWSETLALADAGLFASKQSGRNTWTGFDTSNTHCNSAQISLLKISPKAIFQMDSIAIRKGNEHLMG